MTRGHRRKQERTADGGARPGGGTQGPGFQVDGDLAQRDVFTS